MQTEAVAAGAATADVAAAAIKLRTAMVLVNIFLKESRDVDWNRRCFFWLVWLFILMGRNGAKKGEA